MPTMLAVSWALKSETIGRQVIGRARATKVTDYGTQVVWHERVRTNTKVVKKRRSAKGI